MTNWENRAAVERHSHKPSVVCVRRGTRVPVSTLFENLKDGRTVEQFLEWFLGVDGSKVEGLLERSVYTSRTGRTCRPRASVGLLR